MSGPDDLATAPFVSVIIPVWNGAASIADCLTALSNQDYPRGRYEILVIDNGSTDETLNVVRRFEDVALLHEPKPGSYAARNRGVANANGDLVAFTDADCTPGPGWLSAGTRAALRNPDAGVIGGQIELYTPMGSSGIAGAYEMLFAFKQREQIERGYCVTANWLSRVTSIKALGGFDERLLSGGDFELCERLRATGASIVYADDMVVRHPTRPSVAALARKRRRISAGRWIKDRTAKARIRALMGAASGGCREIGTASMTRGLPPGQRVALAGTVLWLMANQVAQTARMLFGASPPRT